jgi:hypothetical protein
MACNSIELQAISALCEQNLCWRNGFPARLLPETAKRA